MQTARTPYEDAGRSQPGLCRSISVEIRYLRNEHQVDVLQFGADGVALDVLNASLDGLTLNLDSQHCVCLTNCQGGLGRVTCLGSAPLP